VGAGHDHSEVHAHPTRAFAVATLVNLAYTAVEAWYGFATDSLALLSDALHNLGDVAGLALAWGAAVLARRAPTSTHTYGWRRATLLSPLANACCWSASRVPWYGKPCSASGRRRKSRRDR
jgi:cobalt-zinc-cadmium efflux system protein